jgi:hypothetical protein
MVADRHELSSLRDLNSHYCPSLFTCLLHYSLQLNWTVLIVAFSISRHFGVQKYMQSIREANYQMFSTLAELQCCGAGAVSFKAQLTSVKDFLSITVPEHHHLVLSD